MNLFSFILLSLRARPVMVVLSSLALLLGLSLLLLLEKASSALEEHFQKTVGGVHLLVGPRGSETDLLLQGLFFQGTAQTTVAESSYRRWAKDNRVAASARFFLGDSYRGYQVVATDPVFFKLLAPGAPLSAVEGSWPQNAHEVLLGSQVARKLNLRLNQRLQLSHGTTGSATIMEEHNRHEAEFSVSGILPVTGTALDRVLFIPPEAYEILHQDENHRHETHCNGFYLRLKNPRDILPLKWEIQQNKEEPLTAILPGMTLAALRRQIATAESVLQVMVVLVFFSGLLTLGIFMTLLYHERLREMAILRALGAGRLKIALLVLLESWLVYFLSALTALLLVNLVAWAMADSPLTNRLGFPPLRIGISLHESGLLLAGWLCITLAAMLPVIVLYRRSVAQGLNR